MGRYRLPVVIAVVILLVAVVPTVSGHTYSSYCTPGSIGYAALLNIYQMKAGAVRQTTHAPTMPIGAIARGISAASTTA